MFEIDSPGATGIMPTPGPSGAVKGWFQESEPNPTRISADWLNAVQSELLYVLAQAGLAGDKTNATQLYTAIMQLTYGDRSASVSNYHASYLSLTASFADLVSATNLTITEYEKVLITVEPRDVANSVYIRVDDSNVVTLKIERSAQSPESWSIIKQVEWQNSAGGTISMPISITVTDEPGAGDWKYRIQAKRLALNGAVEIWNFKMRLTPFV